MSNTFDPNSVLGLIGLWDFNNGSAANDTGLDDGIAQNGHFHGNASASGGNLVLDGHGDYFDVEGDSGSSNSDEQFDLTSGTVEVQFNQQEHVGSSPDTLVNRGEYDDRGSDGYFNISVEANGAIRLIHCANGQDVWESTPPGIVSPGEDVRVIYTFDQSGGTLTVINDSRGGAETVLTHNVSGLDLDVTDDDDESFTFGAREYDDGCYDQYFKGSIGYVAIYDEKKPEGDGLVEGSTGNDVIDTAYEGDPEGDKIDNSDAKQPGEAPNDDIVLAFQGDDTVHAGAGNDEIFGGSGNDNLYGQGGNDTISGGLGNDMIFGGSGNDMLDGGAGDDKLEASSGNDVLMGGAGNDDLWGGIGNDVIDGGSGNDIINAGPGEDEVYGGSGDDNIQGGDDADLIYGDSNKPGGGDTVRESLEWDQETNPGAGFTQNTGNANVTYSVSSNSGAATTTIDSDVQYATGIETDGNLVDQTSSLGNILNGAGNQSVHTLEWDEAVTYVSFRVNDIDGDGVVKVTAFAPDGSPIAVNLEGGKDVTLLDTDGMPGADTADSNGGYDPDTSPDYSILVTVPGPVDKIVIDHSQDGGNNSGINITDVYFDVVGDDTGADGNDTINGGGGDDTIFGEGGNDTIDGGAGADQIDAGDDRDTILGDAGDTVDGGAGGDDYDVLDLTGQGPFYLTGPDGTGQPIPDSNGNGFDGRVIFVDATGEPNGDTINFTEIEEIRGDNVGQPPVANDDVVNLDEDTDATFDPTANDTDPDGDPLTVVDISDPANGTLVDNGDGTYTYVPDENFNGTDSVTYTVTDGNGNTDTATVTFNVAPVNDAPDAVNDVAVTDEEVAVTLTPLDNDTDVDGDDLTITAASVPAEQGTATVSPDGKSIEFVPAEDFFGDATISYSITDGNGGTDVAEIVVTVNNINDAPTAVDDIASTDEDVPVVIDLLGNDTDPDGDTLELASVSVDPAVGSVTDNGDGTVTFTPAPNFNGPVVIDYTVSDGNGGTDDGQAFVSVGAVNDGPTANDDTATTDEDTPVTIDVVANDTDPDGDPLEIIGATVPASQGTVDIVGNQLVFTPAENYNGPATIDYTISDGNGGTSSAQVDVTVTPVNDDPVAVDDIETTDEDVPVVVDLLGNDFDVDGDTLEIASLSVDPAEGSVVDNGDGTVTFTPALNFNGPATITYTVSDGNGGTDTGEAVVSVGAVNDAPIAEDDTATTDEDTPVTVNVLANDSDPDGDPIEVISATVPASQGSVVDNGDGTLTFTPAPDFTGTAVVTYTISDGMGLTDTATLTIDVASVNDAPEAMDDEVTLDEDDSATFDPTLNDSDPDGDPLVVSSIDDPANGTITDNGDGTFTYTPDPDFNGTETITYEVSDGNGGTDTATITFVVAPVNDDPDAMDDTATTDEDTPVDIPVLGNDVDVDGDTLTIDSFTQPANGTVTDNGDGTLKYTPDPEYSGPDSFTYTVSDGNGGTDTATVNINVAPVNDAPDAEDDSATTPFNTAVVVPVLTNDSDPDGDPLTIDSFTQPANGTVTDNGDGTLTYTPDAGHEGADSFTYTISDGNGGFDTASVFITVEDEPLNFIVEGTDGADLIDDAYTGDPQGDMVDAGDNQLGNDDDVILAFGGDDTVYAGEGDDDVDGGEGNDFIDGGVGDDILDGGAGDDTIIGGDGSDIVEDLEGNNIVDTSGSNELVDDKNGDGFGFAPYGPFPAAPADTDENDDKDIVTTGDGNDIITTGDDDDIINSGGGNDIIDSGIDDDFVNAGAGDDIITTGEGNDTVEAGDGDDIVYGGLGPSFPDVINIPNAPDGGSFGPDPDEMNGQDVIDGGAGNDQLFGEDDDDVLIGGSGDDLLDGGVDDDVLTGGTGNDTLIGGQGVDNMSGGDDRDTFIVDNADHGNGDTIDGNEGGDDFDTLDLTGAGPLRIIYDPLNNENGTVQFLDGIGGPVKGTLEFVNIENVIPCFTPGTLIATPKGERLVEELREGDKIITRDNGIQEIRWIGQRNLNHAELKAAPHLRPVLIKAGSLGNGLPERDMLVSPNHRVLVANDKTALYFEEREVLAAAKHLVGQGIEKVETLGTSYIHFMCDRHEVVLSNGAWTESFQPGDVTLGGMGNAQRTEIFELFPELKTTEGREAYASARRTLKKHEAKLVAVR